MRWQHRQLAYKRVFELCAFWRSCAARDLNRFDPQFDSTSNALRRRLCDLEAVRRECQEKVLEVSQALRLQGFDVPFKVIGEDKLGCGGRRKAADQGEQAEEEAAA